MFTHDVLAAREPVGNMRVNVRVAEFFSRGSPPPMMRVVHALIGWSDGKLGVASGSR